MLLLLGQFDYTENKKAMYRLSALCPEASIQLLPDAGHFTVMESPKAFMKHLQRLLERVGATRQNNVDRHNSPLQQEEKVN